MFDPDTPFRSVLLEKDLEVKKFMSFPCHFEGLRWKLEAIQIPKSHLQWIASRWIFPRPKKWGFKKSMENWRRRLTEFLVTFQCFWSFWHFPFLWWTNLFKTILFWSVSLFWGGTGWVFAKTTLRNLLSPIFSTPCSFLGCCKPCCMWPRRPNLDRWWAVYIAASEKEVRGTAQRKPQDKTNEKWRHWEQLISNL